MLVDKHMRRHDERVWWQQNDFAKVQPELSIYSACARLNASGVSTGVHDLRGGVDGIARLTGKSEQRRQRNCEAFRHWHLSICSNVDGRARNSSKFKFDSTKVGSNFIALQFQV